MIAPTFTGRQWVEEDGAAEPTALADVSLALHEQQKRQLGFALTLGDAVFSIGLGPNGLPAFTVELNPPVAPAPTPTPAATTQPRPPPIPTSPAATPAPTARTQGTTPTAVLPPPSSDNTLPASSNTLLNTDTDSSVLPTLLLPTTQSTSSRP